MPFAPCCCQVVVAAAAVITRVCVRILNLGGQLTSTPTPWLTLFLVLGKKCVTKLIQDEEKCVLVEQPCSGGISVS